MRFLNQSQCSTSFYKIKLFQNGNSLFTISVLIFMFCSNLPSFAQCPTSNIVENPQEFQWTFHPVSANNPRAYYSGVMEVGEETFTINGETLTTRAYRQQGGSYSIPAPTIRVVPGNKYVLRLQNTLPYEPKNPNDNIFKDPNVVNLHTHGLHISGESPGDDITRSFEGGFGGDFVYDIPADHMGGTFWYHAHHHGSSFLQVSGGMFGMLIVDDGNDGIPANVSAMTERELIFGFIDPGAAGTGGDQLMSGTLSPTWTVNGLVQGNICLPPNTWQHWRVLLADRNANIKTLEFGPGVEVMLMSRDGVWRTIAPKAISTNKFELTGASRADFAIRTTANSWVKINGTNVANITASGTSDTSVHPFAIDGVSTWSANRPNYLRDLRTATNVNKESISMGARTINGSKYNHHEANLSLPVTQVQEWSLSGAVQHPFHLHIYHVQALANDGDFEAGEYYDVVSAKMSVRFDLNQATSSPYNGRTILHCHILSHEDRGAMGWLDVMGGAGPPTFPADGDVQEAYSEYYSLGGVQLPPNAPSGLSATAGSSSSINLNWTDNAANEDGFDIERSTDGTNFTYLSSVGTDINSYTNSGLTASTTYYYRILAYNGAGISDPSNVASTTTLSSGGGVVMHVESISVVRELVGQNRLRAVATINIRDNAGAIISGATVSGSFTGPTFGNVSGITDASGSVSLNSKAAKNAADEWCYEVTAVSLSGASYDSTANIVTKACESGPAAKDGSVSFKRSTELLRTNLISLKVYPNPFQNSTNITFQISQPVHTTLEIYSVLGKRIAQITDQSYEAGQHSLEWKSSELSSGVYFLQFKAGKIQATRRLVVIR